MDVSFNRNSWRNYITESIDEKILMNLIQVALALKIMLFVITPSMDQN